MWNKEKLKEEFYEEFWDTYFPDIEKNKDFLTKIYDIIDEHELKQKTSSSDE